MVFSKMLTWQYLLTKVTNSRRKFGSRVRRIFLIKKKTKTNKVLAVGLVGLFWGWNKVGSSHPKSMGLDFGFGR